MADLLKITHAAGHSKYNTPGKQDPEGMKEWEYTNEIVKLVIEELSHYKNVAQLRIDDPTGKVDYSLPKRYNAVNDWNSDIHIDYHLNAYGSGGWTSANGIETFVDPSKPKEAVSLATKVQANLVKELKFANRGVKYAAWDMIHFTKNTAILIEFAFMTNKDEAYKMRTKEYQKKAAKAVVDSLVSQYKLVRNPEPKQSAKKENVSVVYEAHVQSIGWQGTRKDGQTAGTTGQSKRLEALTVKLEGTDAKLEMQGHVESIGWASLRTNGEVIGTMGESLRLEAVKLKVEGLNIHYRVHVQSIGWTDWKKNGEVAGTTGQKKRIEAIEIKLA
jgi:hypothetical protein